MVQPTPSLANRSMISQDYDNGHNKYDDKIINNLITLLVIAQEKFANHTTTRPTKRSVEGSNQHDINAILVKILDRIVKAHEDAAKPSNPWNSNTIATYSLSAVTLLIGQAAQQAIPAAQQGNQPQPAPQPTLIEQVNTLSTDLQNSNTRLDGLINTAVTRLNGILTDGANPSGLLVDVRNTLDTMRGRLDQIFMEPATQGAPPTGRLIDTQQSIGALNARLNQLFDDSHSASGPTGTVVEAQDAIRDLHHRLDNLFIAPATQGAPQTGLVADAHNEIRDLRGRLDRVLADPATPGGPQTGLVIDADIRITSMTAALQSLKDDFEAHESKTSAIAHIASS
ncbi:hypothetical protein Brms1b_004903 [Colletotrichum noveboracense]|nr:hypothetical protein COL940_004578 [Colletotrichum noveboracense]KAJ0317377.1 hypothetical protein Brms1b_004903 [Colletotrichum noveboracense]